jgi:hypothetical protein
MYEETVGELYAHITRNFKAEFTLNLCWQYIAQEDREGTFTTAVYQLAALGFQLQRT